MKYRILTICLGFWLLAAAAAHAGPILKPRKYHGPIPRNAVSLRVGFLGGADNQEMIGFIDAGFAPPFEAFSNDFDNAISIEATFTRKLHPQFAIRGNVSANFLRSDGNGKFVPSLSLPDSVPLPQLNYSRAFDVDLFLVEATGVYFFTDAAVKEFQPYIGGGFSIGVPHAKYKEDQIVGSSTDQYFTHGELFKAIDRDRWTGEAGVHAILGAYYYFASHYAVNLEGRYQLMQSKFPLETTNEVGQAENVNFVVDYTGFFLAVGITRAF